MRLIELIGGGCVCGPEPLEAGEAERIAEAFRVLGDPARLRLFSIIASGGEACVCNLTGPLGLSQPTVSHHLKLLHDAGLLDREKRGTWVYYRAIPEALDRLRRVLETPSVSVP